MKEKVFKYSTLSLLFINFWTLYLFFCYFFEHDEMFCGLGLLANYSYSLLFIFGYGIILLIIRLFFYFKKKTYRLETNFFYILAGTFNLNLFIIWITCIVLKIFEFEFSVLDVLAIGSFLISLFIIVDIYKSVFLAKHQ